MSLINKILEGADIRRTIDEEVTGICESRLEFEDFYDIAEYGNKNWKGSFTPKEVAQNAYDYMLEYEDSCSRGKATSTIEDLYQLLVDDGSDAVEYWIDELKPLIGVAESKQLKEKKAVYLCHSERSDRRSDEKDVEIHTNKILEPGDDFELDGLTWYVDKILKDEDRGIGEGKKITGRIPGITKLTGIFSWNGWFYGKVPDKKADRYYRSKNARFDATCGGTEEIDVDEYSQVAEKYAKVFR